VMDFIDEKYAFPKSLDTHNGGKIFSALTDEQRTAIM
jgi:hypothetical protein